MIKVSCFCSAVLLCKVVTHTTDFQKFKETMRANTYYCSVTSNHFLYEWYSFDKEGSKLQARYREINLDDILE